MIIRFASLALFCVTALSAADWPQFGGPNGAKVAMDGHLARSWPEAGPKKLWQMPVGLGFAAPAVRDGKVYLLDRVATNSDALRCLDFATGQEEWSLSYDAPGEFSYPGSRSTPAVDDQVVATIGSFGQVQCVDKATHQRLWMRSVLASGSKVKPPRWGVAQSPLLYKDLVIVAPLNSEASLAAFDKLTGKPVWKAKPLDSSINSSYTSPLLVNVQGVDQIVMLGQVEDKNDRANLFGVNPADGTILWTFSDWGCCIGITQPLYCGDGLFFLTGGYNANSALVQVSKQDGAYAVKLIFNGIGELGYTAPKKALASDAPPKPGEACSSHLHMPVFFRGCIYANGNSLQNAANGLVCLGLDGLPKWKTGKSVAVEIGDLIVADDLLVSLSGDGVLRLAEASPAAYKQLAQARVLEQKKQVWCPLVCVDGRLLVRDDTILKCLDLREQK